MAEEPPSFRVDRAEEAAFGVVDWEELGSLGTLAPGLPGLEENPVLGVRGVVVSVGFVEDLVVETKPASGLVE